MLLLGVRTTDASHVLLLGGSGVQVGAAGGTGDCVPVCGLQRCPRPLCPLHTLPLLPVSLHRHNVKNIESCAMIMRFVCNTYTEQNR